MINVFYDISVLGMAQVDNRARTGVYRVVQNVAEGLMQSSAAETRFCSSIDNDKECQDYLRGHHLLKSYDKSFVSPLSAALDEVKKVSGIWKRLSRIFTSSNSNPVVYHSPYHTIPQDVLARPDVGKVLTVYDLIPVLFPDYFNEGADLHFGKILGSLTEDTNIICISESTKNDLCNFLPKIDPKRVSVAYLAASDEFISCTDSAEKSRVRSLYSIPEDAKYFLSVCTLEPRKNVEQTIKSFVRLLNEQNSPDLYLVLTGAKGWKYVEIFSEIENAESVKDRILLTGFVPDENLAPLYSDALAFVYPSRYEGFGLPVLEAMQCGTPVITSNTSSLPEVVGDAGIMVDPDDGNALCKAMLDLYRDEGLRDMLSKKGIARASKFSWERCVSDTIDVYRRAAVE